MNEPCAMRYWVAGHCRTPLRTGGTQGDPEQVLRRADGRPMLQAASLAGALRAALDAETAAELFGSQESEGAVLVSDVLFPGARMNVRPRLAIDAATGTARDGGKFDVAHLETGSRFAFALVWRGTAQRRQAAAEALEMLLARLDAGVIRLGAQKSNGFGWLALDEVRRRCYDLFDADQRAAWLEDEDEPVPAAAAAVRLPEDVPDGRTRFTVEADLQDLLVKNGAPRREARGTIQANIEEAGRVVVPGSSLKGAMRAYLRQLLAGDERLQAGVEALFGAPAADGTPRAGRLQVSDAVLQGQNKQVATRIRIDRFTGGVIRKAMFCEETHSGRCRFTVTLRDNDALDRALVLLALRDLGLGEYSLGSGDAIGRGRAQELHAEVCAGGRTVSFTCRPGAQPAVQDPENLLEHWMGPLGGDPA